MALQSFVPCMRCLIRFTHGRILNSLTAVRSAHKYAQVEVKPSKFTSVYRDLHGAIDEETSAKNFVYALDKNERSLLQIELQKFGLANDLKEPVDPASRPTSLQLRKVGLHNALPFIGFGFLDNFLMIIAGEYIEFKFGAMLGISTMAAAAFGNWISDLAGVQSAHHIEVLCSKFGVRAPALTPQQVDMSSTRWASSFGKAIGISIGCVLGMFPLLFLEPRKKTNKEADDKDSPS